jgi:ribosomal protein S18 acetylase RimI-like enzyme
VSRDDIILRAARRSDAATIAAMSRDLIEMGLGWHYRTGRVERLLDDAETAGVVALSATRIVGFAIMTLGADHAHFVLLAVRPSHRQRGVGRRVVEWLITTAATAGVQSVHVELRARNRSAYVFYRALGFAETLRLDGYYAGRETAIRMMRLLRQPGVVPQAWSPPTFDNR